MIMIIVRMVDNEDEIDVTEVSGDFFLAADGEKLRDESRSVAGG